MASSLANKPDSKRKGGKSKKTVTTAQAIFVKQVKKDAESCPSAGKSAPFIFQPPEIIYSGNEKSLDVNKWYYHDVLVCAPHLNYPKLKVPCKCGGSYQPKQWAEDRIIFGLNGRVTLLQFRYECNKCKTTKTTGEIVKLEECPDIIRFNTQRQYYLTKGKKMLLNHIYLLFT